MNEKDLIYKIPIGKQGRTGPVQTGKRQLKVSQEALSTAGVCSRLRVTMQLYQNKSRTYFMEIDPFFIPYRNMLFETLFKTE